MKIITQATCMGNFRLFLSPFLVVFVLSMFSFQNYAQSCDSEFNVFKNRDARSVSENNSTRFQFEITNNKSKAQTYQLVAEKIDGSCKIQRSGTSSAISEAKLNISFYKKGLTVTSITVPAREKVSFQALVQLAPGEFKPGWQCIEIVANSDNCINGTLSTIIKVYVSDSPDN